MADEKCVVCKRYRDTRTMLLVQALGSFHWACKDHTDAVKTTLVEEMRERGVVLCDWPPEGGGSCCCD